MMIPKSVSGSTRIVALAAVIVAMPMPGSGWAWEAQEYIYADSLIGITRAFKLTDASGDVLLTCDEHMRNCTGPLMDGCYRQMQEAIRVMDRAGSKIMLTMSSLSDWQQTIKQCVEDTP